MNKASGDKQTNDKWRNDLLTQPLLEMTPQGGQLNIENIGHHQVIISWLQNNQDIFS